MSLPSDNHLLDTSDPALPTAFAAVLRRHNYTPYGLYEALGEDHGTTLKRIDLPIYLRQLHDTPLHHLIRLFLLGVPVASDVLTEALVPLTPDALVRVGLLSEADGEYTSPYRLMVFEDLFLVCDRFLHGDTLRPDHVTGVNQTSVNLAALTVRRSGHALDLGTGCGVQALLASRHCERVVATDVNPRALDLARFNAALNGVTQVEWRQGSLFEPVTGEQFDLIVTNPPYVISPRTDYVFRAAGFRGDDVTRLVVTQTPRHLRPGGYATVLCDWIHAPDEPWWTPLKTWVAESQCDALFLCHRTTDPVSYAAGWTRQPSPPDADTQARLMDEWLAYYAELGIQAISGGAVILRRSDNSPWLHAEWLAGMPLGACGAQLHRMFAAQDFLHGLSDARVFLKTVFAPVDSRIDQTLTYHDGEWRADAMRVRQDQGLGFETQLDGLAMNLLFAFDGRQALGPLIRQVARTLDINPNEVASDLVNLTRRWVELGFLEIRK